MKRSRRIRLVLMSTVPLLLTACEEAPQEVGVYRDVAECVSGGLFTEPECKQQIADIQKEYVAEAPKYATREECEAANGAAACGTLSATNAPAAAASSGGGSIWMPLLAGYMMGRLGGGMSQPMYPGRQAGFFRSGGGQDISPGNQRFQGAQVSAMKSSRSAAVSRGGFGSRMSGSSSAG